MSDRLAPCPECGQPPRCGFGECPRAATTIACEDGPLICGQHYRDYELANAEEEWSHAADQIEKFAAVGRELCNWALDQAFDIAWAEAQMRVEAVRTERKMIWEQ